MDVLSTVLKTVKLEGAMSYNAEFSAPWSFRSPPSCLGRQGHLQPVALAAAVSGQSRPERPRMHI
jgi:hypothetical protein